MHSTYCSWDDSRLRATWNIALLLCKQCRLHYMANGGSGTVTPLYTTPTINDCVIDAFRRNQWDTPLLIQPPSYAQPTLNTPCTSSVSCTTSSCSWRPILSSLSTHHLALAQSSTTSWLLPAGCAITATSSLMSRAMTAKEWSSTLETIISPSLLTFLWSHQGQKPAMKTLWLTLHCPSKPQVVILTCTLDFAVGQHAMEPLLLITTRIGGIAHSSHGQTQGRRSQAKSKLTAAGAARDPGQTTLKRSTFDTIPSMLGYRTT